MLSADGHDGEPVAACEEFYIAEPCVLLHLGKRNGVFELFTRLHIHHIPARMLWGRFSIGVIGVWIPGGVIGVACPYNFNSTGCVGRFAVTMVEDALVPHLHLIAHKVSRLIVAYPIPGLCLIWTSEEIIVGEAIGFGFKQPVSHQEEKRHS